MAIMCYEEGYVLEGDGILPWKESGRIAGLLAPRALPDLRFFVKGALVVGVPLFQFPVNFTRLVLFFPARGFERLQFRNCWKVQQGFAGKRLNAFQRELFSRVDQGQRRAFTECAARSADAVDVVVGSLGTEALITHWVSGTSMPRLATSVAMRICTAPVLKSCMALMRAFCPLLLCTARTPLSNERSRNLNRFSASSLRRVKINNRSSPSCSRTYHSMNAILVRRLGNDNLYWGRSIRECFQG